MGRRCCGRRPSDMGHCCCAPCRRAATHDQPRCQSGQDDRAKQGQPLPVGNCQPFSRGMYIPFRNRRRGRFGFFGNSACGLSGQCLLCGRSFKRFESTRRTRRSHACSWRSGLLSGNCRCRAGCHSWLNRHRGCNWLSRLRGGNRLDYVSLPGSAANDGIVVIDRTLRLRFWRSTRQPEIADIGGNDFLGSKAPACACRAQAPSPWPKPRRFAGYADRSTVSSPLCITAAPRG